MIDRLGPLLSFFIPGILLLGVVIFVHEVGHFLAAKAVGVKVLRFSIGFGPRLAGIEVGETEYRLSWIPLGGYVQMAGDAPEENGTMPYGKENYLSHPWYGRVLIAIAGPLANLITAFLVLCSVGMVGVTYVDQPSVLGALPDTSAAVHAGLRSGDRVIAAGDSLVHTSHQIEVAVAKFDRHRPLPLRVVRGPDTLAVSIAAAQRQPVMDSLEWPEPPPVVGDVMAGMPAYKAGFQAGDRVLAVEGDSVSNWSEMREHISAHADRPLRFTIERGGQVFDLTVVPVNSTGGKGGAGQIGISAPTPMVYVERYSLRESFRFGLPATAYLIASVYRGMWLTVSRPLYYREYLGGPLFIAQAASEEARRGLDSFLQFLAMINVAVMAFNLLPVPILDGGHILLAAIEAITGRPISVRIYLNFQRVGLVVLGTLFLLILANDPWRVIQRRLAIGREPHSTTTEHPVAPAPP